MNQEQLAEMAGIATEIKRLNPKLEIRYNDGAICYVVNGIVGMIVSRIFTTGQIVTMFDRPLNLSVNGAKPEDYIVAEAT